jgi:hypothetical protein
MTDDASHAGATDSRGEALEPTAAHGVKQAFDVELEVIRNSHHLNEEGKQAAIAEAYVGAEKRYQEAIVREESEATERVVAAEDALFKLTSGHADYRAALDRAEYAGFGEPTEIRDQELTKMLDRATLVGDEKQAMAIFHIAVERGSEDLINRYLERRPEKAQLAQRLMEAQESEQRVREATGWARSYPIRKPPELNSAVASRFSRARR